MSTMLTRKSSIIEYRKETGKHPTKNLTEVIGNFTKEQLLDQFKIDIATHFSNYNYNYILKYGVTKFLVTKDKDYILVWYENHGMRGVEIFRRW